MRCVAKFLHYGSLEKWIFKKLPQTAQGIGSLMCSVFEAYPFISLRCVQCMVTLLLWVPRKADFQQLLKTGKIMGSVIPSVSVGYSVRLMPSTISPYWGS